MPLTYVVNVYSDMSLYKGHLGSRGAKHLVWFYNLGACSLSNCLVL